MKKTILALALGLLAASATAQQGLYCANTGVNTNTGATTSSFRTSFRQLQRGTGTITLNATSTVTSSGAFSGIDRPDAVPGGAGFFKTSGIHFIFGGRGFFYRVSAKASDSSITVLAGAGSPAQSGTTTEWWYWSTVSYRSASTFDVFTDASTITDRRIWETPSGLKSGFEMGDSIYRPLASFSYRPAAGIAYVSKILLFWRPAGVPITALTSVLNSNGDTTTTAESVNFPNTSWPAFIGAELQDSLASTASDNFIVSCIWRGKP